MAAGLCLWWASLASAAPRLSLEGDSQAGHVTLSWQPSEGTLDTPSYQVQEASSEGFGEARTVYEGTHTASVISGMPDGVTFYRVRQQGQRGWGDWSETASFRVEHPSAQSALTLFAFGAFIFMATAAVIVVGNRREAVEQAEAKGDP